MRRRAGYWDAQITAAGCAVLVAHRGCDEEGAHEVSPS